MSQEIHKCPICGHEWLHGKSGEHDCTKRLLERINFLKTMVDGAESTIRRYEEQDKVQRTKITILENQLFDKVRAARKQGMEFAAKGVLEVLAKPPAPTFGTIPEDVAQVKIQNIWLDAGEVRKASKSLGMVEANKSEV